MATGRLLITAPFQGLDETLKSLPRPLAWASVQRPRGAERLGEEFAFDGFEDLRWADLARSARAKAGRF